MAVDTNKVLSHKSDENTSTYDKASLYTVCRRCRQIFFTQILRLA